MECTPKNVALIALIGIITYYLPMSFKRVHTLDMGLDYNTITQSISAQSLSNGMHFLGSPWHRVLLYPKTMQNIQFSSGKAHDELHARTNDGLQVVLEVSFQYQFLIEELHSLFEDYGEDGYTQVYFDVASHLISEAATEYSAYEFFSSKEAIAIKMALKLDAYFKEHLHASVISLQIQSSMLPDSFNDAITDTMTQRQNITNAQKYLEQQQVQLETSLIVAEKQKNATIAIAEGQATEIALRMEAAAVVAAQNGQSEAMAYRAAKQSLQLSSKELLRYIWYDSIEGANSDGAQVLVGVSPSTLLPIQPSAAPLAPLNPPEDPT